MAYVSRHLPLASMAFIALYQTESLVGLMCASRDSSRKFMLVCRWWCHEPSENQNDDALQILKIEA
jgi:hypothetical protein